MTPRGDRQPTPGRKVAPADARERLLFGLQQAIEQKGYYRETKLTDVVRFAQASRRTFYLVFDTKDAALLALIEKIEDELIRDLNHAVDAHSGWREQVTQAVTTYFDHISRRPAVQLCNIRELPYLGDIAAPVIRRGNEAMVAVIHKLTDNEEFRRGGLAPSTRPLAMMIIGALNELVADTLESGRDIREELALAIAATTALLATNFEDRRTPQPTTRES